MMRRSALVALLTALACRSYPPFTEPMTLGGNIIAPEVLNDGRESYMLYCYACHGEKGDGHGPAAPGMRPPPRDFTRGIFKFAGVAAGGLPNHEDLVALVKQGLEGTPMLPWDMSEREREAAVHYIKTFSDRWKSETPGDRVAPNGPDPWLGREADAVATGEKLYHLLGAETDPQSGEVKTMLVGCNACHPSYLPRQDITALSQRVLARDTELREDPFRPAPKESDYTVYDVAVKVIPTDFLFQPLKHGSTPDALFRTIAAGIGGTAMPQWQGSLPDRDLWALSHYVRSLAQLRDTPRAAALRARLR